MITATIKKEIKEATPKLGRISAIKEAFKMMYEERIRITEWIKN